MQIVLSDHNCEGQARAIFWVLAHHGYLDLVPMELRLFADVGLAKDTNDEDVWRFCQYNDLLLLTGNRKTTDGLHSLEMVIRRDATPGSLPAITISSLRRVLNETDYRDRCAQRLAEIVFDIDNYRGLYRVYIPG